MIDDNQAKILGFEDDPDKLDEGWESEQPVSGKLKHTQDLDKEDLIPLKDVDTPTVLEEHEIPVLSEQQVKIERAALDASRVILDVNIEDVSGKSGREALDTLGAGPDVQIFSGKPEPYYTPKKLRAEKNIHAKEDSNDARLDAAVNGASVYMVSTPGEDNSRHGIVINKDDDDDLTVVMTTGPAGDMYQTDLANVAAVSAAASLGTDPKLGVEAVFTDAKDNVDRAQEELSTSESETGIIVARLDLTTHKDFYTLGVAKRGDSHVLIMQRDDDGKYTRFSVIAAEDIPEGQRGHYPVSKGNVVVIASNELIQSLGGVEAAGKQFLFALDTGASPQILCNEAMEKFEMDWERVGKSWTAEESPIILEDNDPQVKIPKSIVAFEVPTV